MCSIRQIFHAAIMLVFILSVSSYNGLNSLDTLQRIITFLPRRIYFGQNNYVSPVLGGGTAVFQDYRLALYKNCPFGFTGCLPHPTELQYYYVCNRDSFILAKCANLQFFNATFGYCQSYKFLNYFQPICTRTGHFPIPGEQFIYYSCNAYMEPSVAHCPLLQYFSPTLGVCITPQQIVVNQLNSVALRDSDFPACIENGFFASPHNASLYYACEMQFNQIFLQTRFQCPNGTTFNTVCNNCQPSQSADKKGTTKTYTESFTSLSSIGWFVENSTINDITTLSTLVEMENSTKIASLDSIDTLAENTTAITDFPSTTENVYEETNIVDSTVANYPTVLALDMKSINPKTEKFLYPSYISFTTFSSTESKETDTPTPVTNSPVEKTTTTSLSKTEFEFLTDNVESTIPYISSTDITTFSATESPTTNWPFKDTSEAVKKTTETTPYSKKSHPTSLSIMESVESNEKSTIPYISSWDTFESVAKTTETTLYSIDSHTTSLSITESAEANTISTIPYISSTDFTTSPGTESPITNFQFTDTSASTITTTTTPYISTTDFTTSSGTESPITNFLFTDSSETLVKTTATTPFITKRDITTFSGTESPITNGPSTANSLHLPSTSLLTTESVEDSSSTTTESTSESTILTSTTAAVDISTTTLSTCQPGEAGCDEEEPFLPQLKIFISQPIDVAVELCEDCINQQNGFGFNANGVPIVGVEFVQGN